MTKKEREVVDVKQMSSLLGQLDLHLFAEGKHTRVYDRLGLLRAAR